MGDFSVHLRGGKRLVCCGGGRNFVIVFTKCVSFASMVLKLVAINLTVQIFLLLFSHRSEIMHFFYFENLQWALGHWL